MPTVAILAALPQELAALHDVYHLEHAPELRPLEGHRFAHRTLTVVAVQTGVGKVSAAMAAQRIIDEMEPVALINVGVAGSLDADALRIGDVVVARDCAQHDMDATPLGFALGEVPYTGARFLEADRSLVAAARGADCGEHRIHEGRVLSGDQFIRRPSRQKLDQLAELGGMAVEMEAAAVAHVAAANSVPFAVVRTISDFADGSAAVDFERFLPLAAANSLAVVGAMLDYLLDELAKTDVAP